MENERKAGSARTLSTAVLEVYKTLDELREWLSHIHRVTGGPNRRDFPYGSGGRDAELLRALQRDASRTSDSDWVSDEKLRTWEHDVARGAPPPLEALLEGYRKSRRRLVELLKQEVRDAPPAAKALP